VSCLSSFPDRPPIRRFTAGLKLTRKDSTILLPNATGSRCPGTSIRPRGPRWSGQCCWHLLAWSDAGDHPCHALQESDTPSKPVRAHEMIAALTQSRELADLRFEQDCCQDTCGYDPW